MIDWDQQEKSEQPTQARREEVRRRGHVPRSADLTVALSVLGALAAIYHLGPWLLARGCHGVSALLGEISPQASSLGVSSVGKIGMAAYELVLLAVLPVALASGGFAVASIVLQGGVAFRWDSLQPDFRRMSIGRTLGRILSTRSLARAGFTGLKLLGVGVSFGWLLYTKLGGFTTSPGAAGSRGGDFFGAFRVSWTSLWQELSECGLKVALLLVAFGLLEYLFERWQYERDLRMSRAELEEEELRLEGNREYRSRRRKQGAATLERVRKSMKAGEEA